MAEPIQNQDEKLHFETDYTERTIGLKKFSNDWKGILQECENDKVNLSSKLQQEFPVATLNGEPRSALASMLELSGIILNDDKKNGVYSTPLNVIGAKPWKKALFLEGAKSGIRSKLQGYKDIVEELAAASSAQYAQGSSVHPRQYLPLRDASRMTAFPPLSAVSSQVTMQNGQLVIPEFVAKESGTNKGPGPHPWVDGDEIILDTARVSESMPQPKAVAGGFRVTDGLWQSPIGASFVSIQAARYGIRVERVIVGELLSKIRTAANDSSKNADLGLSAVAADAKYSADVITDITMLYPDQDFMVTTLLGNEFTVKKWLNIDRSGHFSYSGIQSVQGMSAGTDTYGKTPVNRMIYNIPSSITLDPALTNNQLLAIDAMETGSVYTLEETQRETAMDLERSTAFSYTLKYVTTLNQADGEPVRLID